MRLPVFFYIVVLALLLQGDRCYAQADSFESEDFIACEKVIFYDDLSTDAVNTFPAHWYIQPGNNAKPYTSLKLCRPGNTTQPAMIVTAQDTPPTTDNMPEPKLNEKDYLPDSFTLQFDFLLSSAATGEVLYIRSNTGVLIPFTIYNKDKRWVIEMKQDGNSKAADIPGEFDATAWHTFSLSFHKQKITCYLDDIRILTVRSCSFNPASFIVSAKGTGDVSYTNVRSATGSYLTGDQYGFSKLFTADKFTTHAIHFDTKLSTIQPGSMDFIKKLATWLKQNPAIKLEIDGHTDNEGTDVANLKLSQDRADEVKKQLVALGVNQLRLSVKGYGAGKPIQTNSTPEGKADNRRVEFIKL